MEHAVFESASRKGIPANALMKMRWVVTTKADDNLKARLVVQGFTDARLGKLQTAVPTVFSAIWALSALKKIGFEKNIFLPVLNTWF